MKVVLFDIDHTIMASPKGANARASERMFQQLFGIKASEDSVEKVGMTEWGIIEKVLRQNQSTPIPVDDVYHRVSDEAYKTWAKIFEEEIKDQPSTLLPGIWELVEALHDTKDFKIGLLTGNSYWRSEAKLKAVGMDEFFRERSGRLVGAFGNEARTREGLIAFAQDRLVFDNDTMSLIDDSLIGANMIRGRRDIFGIFVATGSASQEQLAISDKPVFEDLDEDRWKVAYELLLKYA